ncbi:hypothetical protein BDN67DRAFT_965803 [Paxillus ammoniavirescens]|nr:hypothetical protein BDN67DRAFT_965803 [Paxillus ammoniavirescens]
MFRSALSVAVILSNLLGLSSRASAMCLACSNCLYDPLPNNQGNVCLNYWTCSGNTITCYYPSTEYPGTFTACEFTGSGYDFTLTSTSPAVCDGSPIGDNSKCEPSNNPWNVGTNSCTASEVYVGEGNSGLL